MQEINKATAEEIALYRSGDHGKLRAIEQYRVRTGATLLTAYLALNEMSREELRAQSR